MMENVLLITGGNRSDSPMLMAKALQLLCERAGRVKAASNVYRTQAWGFEADDFCNQAVEIETPLSPEALLDVTQAIERELGRNRTAEAEEKRQTGQRYASRPIDVDILYYGELTVAGERLTIPHPAIGSRLFVLEPLAEIAPAKRDPATGITVVEMLLQLKEKERDER